MSYNWLQWFRDFLKGELIMQEERKKIIRYALNFNILDVATYSGYKGDLIVKITTKERDSAIAIRKFALDLDIKEVVIKQNMDMRSFEIFCVTPDVEVYHLKTDDLLEEVHSEHPVKDVWNGSK